jgi:hypothetical protein
VEPVPLWARLVAVLVAAATVPVLVFLVAAAAVALAAVNATVHRTESFAVGESPRLEIDARLSDVTIESGQAGRIVVEDKHDASTISRAGAAAAARDVGVRTRRDGDAVLIEQSVPTLQFAVTERSGSITVQVPARVHLDVTRAGTLRVRGVDGIVNVRSAGMTELRDTTLRSASSLNLPIGDLTMRNVTVSGGVTVTKRVGDVQFDGTMTPGGSSLDIDAGAGAVTIALPRPTDARAAVATQVGTFTADPSWGFASAGPGAPRRWSADLGPDPRGTVTVRTTLGDVDLRVR